MCCLLKIFGILYPLKIKINLNYISSISFYRLNSSLYVAYGKQSLNLTLRT